MHLGTEDPAIALEARTHALRALALDGSDPLVLSQVAICLGFVGSWQEGLVPRPARRGSQSKHGSVPHHSCIGLPSLRQAGRGARPRRRSTHLAPRGFQTYMCLGYQGLAHIQAGRYEQALQALELALQLYPYMFSLKDKAICCEKLGRHEDARDAIPSSPHGGAVPHAAGGREIQRPSCSLTDRDGLEHDVPQGVDGDAGMTDIFLSYSRDDQTTARQFAAAFKQEGLDVWWDATLRSGEAYDQVTERALARGEAVVVLWSKKSVDSRWVRSEATIGDRNHTFVPVMIEPCNRPVMFELTQTAGFVWLEGRYAGPAVAHVVDDVRAFTHAGAHVAATGIRAARSDAQASRTTRPADRGCGGRRGARDCSGSMVSVAIAGSSRAYACQRRRSTCVDRVPAHLRRSDAVRQSHRRRRHGLHGRRHGGRAHRRARQGAGADGAFAHVDVPRIALATPTCGRFPRTCKWARCSRAACAVQARSSASPRR